MNIIKIPLTKIEDAFGGISYELPSNVVLGHCGENLTTEIQIQMDEIKSNAVYTLEFKHADGVIMEKHDGYLSKRIGAEVLVTGDVDVDISWSWKEKIDGEEKTLTDKSKIAKWRVLDSVQLSEALEKQHPEIIAQILADIEDIKQYGGGGGSGRPGEDGEDGFSPEIIVEEVEGGYQFTITHKDTEPTVIILYHGEKGKDGKDGQNGKDGKDGLDGKDGKDGQDGFSPTIEAEAVESGYQMTITNKDAEPTVIVLQHGERGKDGKDGQNGADGKDGQNGKDGENGKDYVITDADYQAIAEYVLTIMEDGDTLKY